ncbi:MAG: hypothetical protein JFT11_08890 [Muribaculaceae bacterium]|nr:hypothetical protein [Muribaculaceae bacterium]
MKHRTIPFILTGIGLITALNATSKNVYVHSSAGEVLESVTGVKRIEFGNGNMTLVPEIGKNVEIELSRLGFFAFKPIGTGGVPSIETTDAAVNLTGDILSVKCASEIEEIRIYNALGEMTGLYVPAACTATMTVDTGGLNIVVVKVGGVTQSYKIVR